MRKAVIRIFLVGFIALALCGASSPVEAREQTVGLFLNEESSFQGYTLFAPAAYGTTYLIDNDGRLVHSWDSDYGPGLSAYLLEDGGLLRTARLGTNLRFLGGGGGGRVERFAWDGTLLWEFEYSSEEHLLHHDVEVLPNGNVLMIAWEHKTSVEAIAAGRDPDLLPDGELWPLHIIEVEPTGASGGNTVWEWHAWDHLIQDYDPTADNYDVVADHPELIDINFTATGAADWNHTNAIDYNPEFDQIVLSLRQFSELWVIDHSTTTEEAAGQSGGDSGRGGDLLYRWGNPQVYRAGDAADRKLFFQHDAQWIEPGLPGEGNILVFNNGPRPDGAYSSVDEIVPPVDSFGSYSLTPGQAYGPVEPTWTYVAPNPTEFFSAFISGAQRLPNGNTLIDDGGHGTFFEVTSEGTIVWKYVNPVTGEGPLAQGDPVGWNFVFRAYRYAPDLPGLEDKDLTPGGPIELYAPDTDGDGCADGEEEGSDERLGGQRDPDSFWDFYDVWSHPVGDPTGWERNASIDLFGDIFGVATRFGASDAGPGTFDRNSDPLSTPNPATGDPREDYHPAFDRGPLVGPNLWDMGPADGSIDLFTDIFGVANQFGHDCAAPPKTEAP